MKKNGYRIILVIPTGYSLSNMEFSIFFKSSSLFTKSMLLVSITTILIWFCCLKKLKYPVSIPLRYSADMFFSYSRPRLLMFLSSKSIFLCKYIYRSGFGNVLYIMSNSWRYSLYSSSCSVCAENISDFIKK